MLLRGAVNADIEPHNCLFLFCKPAPLRRLSPATNGRHART